MARRSFASARLSETSVEGQNVNGVFFIGKITSEEHELVVDFKLVSDID